MRISPFTLSPNPAWMYLTPATLSAIETIRWMVEDRQGLAAIFGDAGTGKSSLLRFLLSEYADESQYTTAYLTRVDFSSQYAFAKKISAEFGVDAKRSLSLQNDALEEFLISEYEQDRAVILFLDEGQQLSAELLEVVRNLLNFETNVHKLIQIVIAGQIELLERIRMKKNKALASRIYSPVLIQPLSESEAIEMVRFRCERARVPCPFTDDAVRAIYQRTGGVPRSILLACSRVARKFPELMQAADVAGIIDSDLRVTA